MTSIGGGQTRSPRAIYSEVCVRNLSELREQRSSGPTSCMFRLVRSPGMPFFAFDIHGIAS
jgi:hypothetical protein